MWFEQLARTAENLDAHDFPFNGSALDFRPLLECVAEDHSGGRHAQSPLALSSGVARGLADALRQGSSRKSGLRPPNFANHPPLDFWAHFG